MAQFRKFSIVLCLFVAPFLIFASISTFALFQTFKAQTINAVMEEKGIYSALTPAIVSTAKNGAGQSATGQIPVKEQWVTDVANKAFPPETMKSLSQTLVNGTFDWLNGKTETPEFSIDLSQNKQLLATAVGEYVATRSASLPICNNQQLLEIAAGGELNIYTAPCRPAYISPESVGVTAKQQVLSDQNLIKDQTLRPETLKNSAGISPFDQLKDAQSFFSNQLTIMIGLLALLSIVLALCIWLADDRARMLKRLSILVLVSSLSILIFTFVIGFSVDRIAGLNLNDQLTSKVLLPTFEGLVTHAQKIYYFGAFCLVVISITLYIIYKLLNRTNLNNK